MSLATRTRAAWRAMFPRAMAKRGFDASKSGRLLADWFAAATSSDAEIRGSIRRLIDRSRDLERNNDYQRGFLLSLERNVIGAIRSDLRMDCGQMVSGGKGAPPKWQPDRSASAMIESAWSEWGKKGTCTVCGRYSWRDVKRITLRALARDGNMLVRKVFGNSAGNRFGFALQVWEIDHLDLQRFDQLKGGGEIRFGVETNAASRVVAYWLRVRHPGEYSGATLGASQVIRVSASEIYHLFMGERAEQTLGYPWIVSAITRLRQLGAFEEAATIAARLGATKAGFFKKSAGANGEEGEFTGEMDDSGRFVMDASPGTFEQLPQGWELDQWSPEYPNIATGDFRKAMLRGVGTSLGVSYNTLGNDMEAVNFSSARVGLFEEREGWKGVQVFFCEGFLEPVFSDWLPAAIMAGAISLPLAKLRNFERPVFKSRRWPFIDPLKEVNAAKAAIALRLSSRRQFIEEGGGDVEEVFHDNLADELLAEEIGLSLQPPDPELETFGTSDAQALAPDDGEDVEDDPSPAGKRGRKSAPATPARAMPSAKDIAAEVIRQTPAAPAAVPASVTIHNAPPAVTVNTPDVRIAPTEVRIENTVLPSPAPSVTVQAARSDPPIVNVTVPPAAPPIVNVTVPPLNAVLSLARDGDGKLTGGKIT